MKVDILAFGAHPDDVELACGGTISKEISKGNKVGIIDLTRGELGTRGTPEIRAQEANTAAKILQVHFREQLGFDDGFFINNKEHQLVVVEVLRRYRPKIVLCNAIDDRHIDHGRGSRLVSDACFLSGLSRIDTGQEVWRPQVVYHYIQWKHIKPDVVVDISDTLLQKIKAVTAYQSQFYDSNSKEPKTPISSKNFLDSVSYRAKDLGRIIGVEAAEGFTVERYPAVACLSDLL